MSLRKQRGNMDQRKKEPPVCANSADTGGFYTNLQIYLANLCNHSIFRHDNFIGCFSADKIKMSARK